MTKIKNIVVLNIMNNSEFYNTLSSNYDLMINFENSLKNKIENLKNFIEPNYKSALDLGCGTGVDSITLSQLGLKVTAIDHSKEMIKIAKDNSENYNCEIDFIKSDLTKINFDKKFDLIISLGNTLANLSYNDLKNLFFNLKLLLNEKGKILIQIINFSVNPKNEDYILNKFENDEILIIRKYHFLNNEINFVIDIFDKIKNQKKETVTKLFPHNAEKFSYLANQNNLQIVLFGNLKMEKFNPEISKDLVIVLSNKSTI
ncbi:MAG: class I SAM-dependent methyltransferase [Ignavibacteriae bacterium]|nr:class I SAM-dependent methyltransferase [Ignavibacteriota bacterium]